MKTPFYQVDAFASDLFTGNPAGVCPLKTWLPDRVMQAIAMENNLSETAFFVPGGQGYDLRWFTPAIEVDLCGHATLATAHVLFRHLDYAQQRLHFHTRSGILTVEMGTAGDYLMDFPADTLEKTDAYNDIIAAALGIAPVEVFTGREDVMVVLSNEKEILALRPDFGKLKQLQSRGLIATAPGDTVDFVSRCFFPNAGIDEDPVTGSAHTTMTPYWAERLDKVALSARQLSARGGAVGCKFGGDRVELSGRAITYLVGEIEAPA